MELKKIMLIPILSLFLVNPKAYAFPKNPIKINTSNISSGIVEIMEAKRSWDNPIYSCKNLKLGELEFKFLESVNGKIIMPDTELYKNIMSIYSNLINLDCQADYHEEMYKENEISESEKDKFFDSYYKKISKMNNQILNLLIENKSVFECKVQ